MSESLRVEILGIIFLTGFIAGIFFGMCLVTGENVNPESLLIRAGDAICEALKNLNQEAYNQCKTNMLLLSIVVTVIGILEILFLIFAADNWILGTIIYISGFISGLILVLRGI